VELKSSTVADGVVREVKPERVMADPSDCARSMLPCSVTVMLLCP